MFRKSLFGLISFVIILAWLVSPIAALAQDETPTDPPVDVPIEILPATDVPTEVAPEVLPADVLPTDVAPVETVVPTEVIVTIPEPAVSLVDVTNALVDTAATVSTGDPSGFLNATAAAAISAKLSSPIGAGTPFNYYYTPDEGGAPRDGTCMVVGPAVTCYWLTPVQQAIHDAAAGTDVVIESGAVYNESVIIGYDMFNLVTICGPDSCPSGLVGTISGSAPVLNGFVSINNVNGFYLGNLTINSYVNIVDSEHVDVGNVNITPSDDGSGFIVSGSSDVTLTNSTINKEGFTDAVSISNSDGVTLGNDQIYVSDPHGDGNVGWGISAYEVTDLSIYDSTIVVRDGAQGGIKATNVYGSLFIGGNGMALGEFDPGQGLAVDLIDTANNSIGILVDNTGLGELPVQDPVGIFIGNGLELNSSFDSLNRSVPFTTTGISVNNITGTVWIGLNSEVNLYGADGTGILVNGVYSLPDSIPLQTGPFPAMPGMAAIGENLEVNLYDDEGIGSGGNGIGINISGVEGLTLVGSLQDFGAAYDQNFELPWDGDHQTDIYVAGEDPSMFMPNIGLSVTGVADVFASGINSYSSHGIGAVFGFGMGIEPAAFVIPGPDELPAPIGNSGSMYLANSVFNGNGSQGLLVSGIDGDVTVDGIEANGNMWDAPDFDFMLSGGAQFSNITGTLDISNSEFMRNYSEGLVAFADDTVTLDNVEVGWNGAEYGGDGIYIGSMNVFTVNILNSYIHNNGWDGIHFGTMFDPIDGFIPYNANVFNSQVVNNGSLGESEGLDYYALGTLTVCGSVVSGNGVDYYVELPGTLVQYPVYPCGYEDLVTPPSPSPIIVNVSYSAGSPGQGSAEVAPDRGLIFNLLEKPAQGAEVLLAQAALPMGSVPGGSHAGFEQKLETSLPAALPDGVSFVGPAFTLAFTLPDGTPITNLDETMQVKFKVPDGFTVPSGQVLAIYLYDASGAWVKLPVTISDGYVYAYTNLLGTFLLALAPVS